MFVVGVLSQAGISGMSVVATQGWVIGVRYKGQKVARFSFFALFTLATCGCHERLPFSCATLRWSQQFLYLQKL